MNNELLEQLADLEHERWSGWMRYMFSKGTKNPDGTWTMPAWAVGRWERQASTPYADLSEQEKESDRVEARKGLMAIGCYLMVRGTETDDATIS